MLSLLIRFMVRRGCFRMIRRRNRETGEIEKYLSRGYIFRSKYFGLFIHQFWASDPDHFHSHPWANFTLVLKGGYHESRLDGVTEFRRPGYFRFRSAEIFHRISIGTHSKGAAWTLFGHFKRTRKWGFLTPEGWVESNVYGEKYNSPVEQEGVHYEILGHFFPRVKNLKDLK